jgi:CTP synthase
VIALITEWKDADGTIQKRDANSDLGGTMRLGAQSSDVARHAGAQHLRRRGHRAPPPPLRGQRELPRPLRQAGLVISALTQREHLTEIVELPQTVHPWYMGVQFHPEFKSTPWDGHPLFNAFVKAAVAPAAAARQAGQGR